MVQIDKILMVFLNRSYPTKRNFSFFKRKVRLPMPHLTPIHTLDKNRHSRINWVDYAKGICILLVVMMHSTLGVEKAAENTGWLGYVVEFSRPFRMPDFFLISGLFLGLVIDRPWVRYLDRKVVHFAYFYILWVSIQFAFKAPVWIESGLSLQMLVANYFMAYVEPFGTLWFIYMLPIFFVVTRICKKIPWSVMLGAAAALEILPISTGWTLIDEFAARYVYFLAGYLFASHVFKIARYVLNNKTVACRYLVIWAIVNAILVFAPTNGFLGIESYAKLPLISLILGAMGAMAIICIGVLLSEVKGTKFLEYLGRNSIVVYLAFFLPMGISRVILLKYAPFLDIGTISAFVMLIAATAPVILYKFIQWSGYGTFLFMRPDWAKIDVAASYKSNHSLPAE